MKKSLSILAAAAIMLSMAACGKKDNKTDDTTTASAQTSESAETTSGKSATVSGMESGKLYYIGDQDGVQILRGIQISGNRSGDEVNKKDPATEGIRCIFELNEWVEFYPDTDMNEGITVWVFEHKDDLGAYERETVSMSMKGFVISLSLLKEEEEGSAWGSFCLNPDSVQPGLYDFVYTYNGNVIASMVTRFYGEGELESKSDAELENLMKNLR